MVDQTGNQSARADLDLRRMEAEVQRVKSIGDQFASSLARGFEGVASRGQGVREVIRGLGQDLSGKTFQAAFKPLTGELQRVTGLGNQVGRSLSKAFEGLVVRGKSLKDVVRGLALDLSKLALNSAFSTSKTGVGSLFQNLFSGGSGRTSTAANGGPTSGGGFSFPLPFARGGVVSAPTYFPISGGRTGVMGERGAEAILPLRRGADGRLGVAAQGGGAININFQVTSPDAAGFQRSETQISAMLARAVSRGERNL